MTRAFHFLRAYVHVIRLKQSSSFSKRLVMVATLLDAGEWVKFIEKNSKTSYSRVIKTIPSKLQFLFLNLMIFSGKKLWVDNVKSFRFTYWKRFDKKSYEWCCCEVKLEVFTYLRFTLGKHKKFDKITSVSYQFYTLVCLVCCIGTIFFISNFVFIRLA